MLRNKLPAMLLSACLGMSAVGQQPFPVVTFVDAPSIAEREVALDAQGKLLPWPMPQSTGYSYSSYFLSQWTVVLDQYERQRLLYKYCCFAIDPTTYELTPDTHWANSTGYLRAMMEGFVERLYPYTGDERSMTFLRDFADYELDHGLTPADYVWPQVPYPSADPGSDTYSGWSEHGHNFIEPHVVGEDGYAYLRLYEMTGERRYLQEALRCANALVRNYKHGNATISPWPFRCRARDGDSSLAAGKGMFPYSANVVEPIMLFDELVRLRLGDTNPYRNIRAGAWRWLMRYPMRNNVWVGYFEDVTASMGAMNQVIPLEFARYILLHPEKDPQWRRHAAQLIEWVKSTPKWPKYRVHGALVTTEQGDGKKFCCNLPNQCCDSHSARLAAVEAFYYARTGDLKYKEEAYRTYNWVTYFQGLPGGAHAPFAEQWWFTDEFADGPRRMMDAFWAVPDWAPADESHLLGSSSVVTKVKYGAGSVTYSTFDQTSEDVLRLDFAPTAITVGGHAISRRLDLQHALHQEGYSFDDKTGILRLQHTTSREVSIEGVQTLPPPRYITFDSPHKFAASVLSGEYPAGLIDWGAGAWVIAAPGGKFGTFNVSLTDAVSGEGSFAFVQPRIFAGVDIYNGGAAPADVTFQTTGQPDVTVTLQPKELRRVRTGWSSPASRISLKVSGGKLLQFDNLAYLEL